MIRPVSARNAGPPDIDLLIVVDDSSLDEHAAPGHLAGVPGTLALASDTRHNAPRGGRAFSEQYILRTPDELRGLRAALIPVAGKYIARRSPDTARLIALAGGPKVGDESWEDQLTALRELLDRHAKTEPPESIAAMHAHLDIVAETLG
jgi:hypothetical protein